MDIAGLSASMSMANLQTAWGAGMVGKALDTAEAQGTQITEMIASVPTAQMELSVNPYLGGNFDMSV